jgi:hypothetical protein
VEEIAIVEGREGGRVKALIDEPVQTNKTYWNTRNGIDIDIEEMR